MVCNVIKRYPWLWIVIDSYQWLWMVIIGYVLLLIVTKYCDGVFMSAFGYANDIILLALCPFALQLMLKMCESFASSYGLQFNASKTDYSLQVVPI